MSPWWLLLIIPGVVALTLLGIGIWMTTWERWK